MVSLKKKVCLKWCDWTMICMIQSYIVTCKFSFALDCDMSCVLFILYILKCIYRGFSPVLFTRNNWLFRYIE